MHENDSEIIILGSNDNDLKRRSVYQFLKMIAGGAGSFLLVVLFLWLQFGGLYHAFVRHSSGDALIAFFVPPFAWYRAVESFWHDRHSEEEWREILSDDANAVFILAGDHSDDADFAVMKPVLIEKLRARVRYYPSERKDQMEAIVDASYDHLMCGVKTILAEAGVLPHDGSDVSCQESTLYKLRRLASKDFVRRIEQMVALSEFVDDGARDGLAQLDASRRDAFQSLLRAQISGKKDDLDSIKRRIR